MPTPPASILYKHIFQVFGTARYYKLGDYKKNNSYIFNILEAVYGQIRSIIVDYPNNNVFLYYNVISPELLHAPNDLGLKHGLLKAYSRNNFQCELASFCEICISVPSDYLGNNFMFIARSVNEYKGS